MRVYQYKTLEPDEIRLLELFGGTSDAELKGSIHSFRLPEDEELFERQEFLLTRDGGITVPNAPEFQALSYTWGAKSKDQPSLTVLDGGVCQKISLQVNLIAALRRLRRDIPTEESHMYWIDALCINQDDIPEKNIQIQKMAIIYNRAESVAVWLGEEDADSVKAMRFIDKFKDLDVFDPLTHDPGTSTEWAALMNLMQRSWFTRRWIVQELALARNAVMYCGSQSISWRDFSCAVALFTSRHQDLRLLFQRSQTTQHHPNFIGEVDALGAKALVDITNNLFRKSKDGKILERLLSLEALMCTLITFESALPHDTIYSVLWLAYDAEPSSKEAAAMAHEALLRTPEQSPKIEAASTPGTDISYLGEEDNLSPVRSRAPSITVSDGETRESPKPVDAVPCPRFPHNTGPLRPSRSIRYHSGRAAGDHSLRAAEEQFDNDLKRIVIDYKQPFFEVCRQFLEFTIARSRSLDILCHPWAPEPIGMRETSLPSWVCSLTESPFDKEPCRNAYGRVRADPLVGHLGKGPRNYNACGKTKASPGSGFIHDRVFIATEFVVDTIGRLRDTAHEGFIPHNWLDLVGWTGPPQDVPDDFWRALVADRGPGGQQQPPSYFWLACKWVFEQKKSRGGINTTALLTSGKCPSIAGEFLRRVQSVIWGRKMGLSQGLKGANRLLALVPEEVQVGDLICILWARSVPVLLRKQRRRKREDGPYSGQESRPRPPPTLPNCDSLCSLHPSSRRSDAGTTTSTHPGVHGSSDTSVSTVSLSVSASRPDAKYGSVNVHNKLLGKSADSDPRIIDPATQNLGISIDSRWQYTLIGPCYIQNLMDGEGFKHQRDYQSKNQVFHIV